MDEYVYYTCVLFLSLSSSVVIKRKWIRSSAIIYTKETEECLCQGLFNIVSIDKSKSLSGSRLAGIAIIVARSLLSDRTEEIIIISTR